MANNTIWKRFEKSGSVKDYLEYACTTEESMNGGKTHYPRDFYEDCFEDECYDDYEYDYGDRYEAGYESKYDSKEIDEFTD